jgi:aromatic-L-amino-acid/L-tryptophan decarboxylase
VSDRFDWSPEPDLIDVARPSARPALEALGEAVWAEALDWLYGEALRRPLHPEAYPESRRAYFGPSGSSAPAPLSPTLSAEILAEFRERIAPATFNAHHRGSFSYFTPPPLPMSIAGEVLGQWLQQGVDVWHAGPVGAFVEEEVVTWLRDLVGFREEGWGVLTSGGVMANIMGMTLARDVWLRKLRGLSGAPRGGDLDGVRVYAGDQAHFSIGRALAMLGFPEGTLRVLPTDDRFRLLAEPVEAAVARDRAEGLTPLAIAAVAGSTNTGSVDDVPALAAVAERDALWLHVDAAYGGAARLSVREAHRVPGLELADTVTVDPHKWFFQAYDLGALIVRRRADLLTTFHRSPEYYRSNRPEDEPLNWYQYSMEGTRRFRGLKLWTSWKHLGTRGLGHLVEATIDLAAFLSERLREAEDFEPAPEEPALSVVCFRHLPTALRGLPDHVIDDYQTRLQRGLEVSGEAWVSTTELRGRTHLRAGVMNYYADRSDVLGLLASLRAASERVLEELDLDA